MSEITNVSNNIKTEMYAGKNDLIWQESTYPRWVEVFNGVVFKYDRYAGVRYGITDQVWISMINDNISVPGTNDSWMTYEDFILHVLNNAPSVVPPEEPIMTVIQDSNKQDPVTLNATKGQVQMSNSIISAGSTLMFRLNNSTIRETDIVLVSIVDSSVNLKSVYMVWANSCNGYATVCLRNNVGSAMQDAVLLNFVVVDKNTGSIRVVEPIIPEITMVTQGANKTYPVTLNEMRGVIRMFSAPIQPKSSVMFTLNNNKMSIYDNIIVNLVSKGNVTNPKYGVDAKTGNGAAYICIENKSDCILSDELYVVFRIKKD